MRKLLILGASEFQIPLIKQAKEMGLYTCIFDINPDAYGVKYADEFYQCSLKDSERALQIAKTICPDGVTAGMCDVAVCTAAIISKELKLPGLSIETAKKSTDKYLMIKAFEEAKVPHPLYILYDKESFDKELLKIPFPIISKPIDMAGSRGVNLIKSKAELLDALNNSLASSDSEKIILEEYMVGPEVSVEIVVKNGFPVVLQITDKITSGPPHFVELGHSQPSGLEPEVLKRIVEVAVSAVKALDINNSIVHAEIIVTSDGPKMVELGARMGGDSIQQQLIQLSLGINLPEIAIKIAFGEDYDIPKPTHSKCSAILFIPSVNGVISSISISDSNIDKDKTKYLKLFCQKGEKFFDAIDNSGRLGYVISQAESVVEAIDNCKDVISKIDISMK